MDDNNFLEKKFKKEKKHRPVLFFVMGGLMVLVLVILISTPLIYQSVYKDNVYPGVRIGNYDVGGFTEIGLQGFLQEKQNRLAQDGFKFLYIDENAEKKVLNTLPIVYNEDGQTTEFISYDIERTVEQAMLIGRVGGFLQRALNVIYAWYSNVNIDAQLVVDEDLFKDVLVSSLSEHEISFSEPQIAYTDASLGLKRAFVVDGESGEIFDYEKTIDLVKNNLYELNFKPVVVPRVVKSPQVRTSEAMRILSELDRVVVSSTVSIVYENPDTLRKYKWNFSSDQIKKAVEFGVAEDKKITFVLKKDSYSDFIQPIAKQIDVLAQEAKFTLNTAGTKASLFKPSKNGLTVQKDEFYEKLNQRLNSVLKKNNVEDEIKLLVEITEPQTHTSDVNSYGIKELLGVGESNFTGSSWDRIKNIKNASGKLNGLIIAPDKEFSLIQALEPITIENGYVPEYVILGDKIEKGVGGGLCQIGTTSFRMAMNSGLQITERRNHSLVVSYYNDATNGNPGTDATIYGPHPDLRFVNNTGNHVLITTEVDVPNTQLKYYLWGTSDGRKGYYTPPVVHEWIPVGEPREIKTTDRPAGDRWCQSIHRGAKTSFSYYIEQPNGKVVEQIFKSDYRPLPEICFVGVTEEELELEKQKELLELEGGGKIDLEEVYKGFATSTED